MSATIHRLPGASPCPADASTAAAPSRSGFSPAADREPAAALPPMHPLHRTAQAALELVQTALSGAFSEDVHHCATTIRNELVQVSLSKHDPALRDAVSMLNTNILRMAEADSQRREVWSWSVPANANLVRVLLNHALIFGE